MLDAILGTWLPYVAATVFVAGIAARVIGWARAPVPLKVTLTPAPRTKAGAAADVLSEMHLLRRLWSGRKELWAGAWLFHISLTVLVLGHIAGIAWAGGVFTLFGVSPQGSQDLSGLLGKAIGAAILAAVLYLLLRRAAIPLMRRISRPEDYLVLLLLLAIVATGDWMRYLTQTDLAAVRDYLAGLATLRPEVWPVGLLFRVHFTLVQALLLVYPVSKLGHTCGYFFTRWMASADQFGTGTGLSSGAGPGSAGRLGEVARP